jgi:hypothetical protein
MLDTSNYSFSFLLEVRDFHFINRSRRNSSDNAQEITTSVYTINRTFYVVSCITGIVIVKI